MFSKLVRKVRGWVPVVLVGTMLVGLLAATSVQAEQNLSVKFDRTYEGPTEVQFRVTIQNPAGKPARGITMTSLLTGLSVSPTEINSVKVERVFLDKYTEEVPVYGAERSLTQEEKDEYLSAGLSPPATTKDVVGYTQVERQRERKENFRNWSFKGSVPDTRSSVTLPGYNADRDGQGKGVLVLDFTINTGLHEREGGWGSAGVLVLDIDGTQYYDLTHSSWWNATWTNRAVISLNASTLTENLINFPMTFYLDATKVTWANLGVNGSSIRFVDGDDITAMSHHTTQWNEVAQNATVVARIPQINQGSNYSDYIYMYYGNAGAADSSSPSNTWAGTGASLVFPFYSVNGSGATAWDSVAATMGNMTGTTFSPSQGRIFDASLDYVSTTLPGITGNLTLEFWVRPAPFGASMGLVDRRTGPAVYYSFYYYHAGGYYILAGFGNVWAERLPVANTPANTWTHLVVTAVNETANSFIYVNGVDQADNKVAANYTSYAATSQLIGATAGPGESWNGTIGETRVFASRARSQQEAMWTYLSERYFYTGNDGRLLYYGSTWPSPNMTTLAATGVTTDRDGVTAATVRGNLTSLGGAPYADTWFEWGLSSAYGSVTGNQTRTSTGIVTAALPNNLVPGETYHYRMGAVGNASSVDGASYSSDGTFTYTLPTVTTTGATGLGFSPTRADLNANVVLNTATDAYGFFQYGNDATYGTNTTEQVVGAGAFTAGISGTSPVQHYRAVTRVGPTYSFGADSTFEITASVVYNILLATSVVLYVALTILMLWALTAAGAPLIATLVMGAIMVVVGTVGVDLILRALQSFWSG